MISVLFDDDDDDDVCTCVWHCDVYVHVHRVVGCNSSRGSTISWSSHNDKHT